MVCNALLHHEIIDIGSNSWKIHKNIFLDALETGFRQSQGQRLAEFRLFSLFPLVSVAYDRARASVRRISLPKAKIVTILVLI